MASDGSVRLPCSRWEGLPTTLQVLMRPPGGGLFSASTGSSPHALALHSSLFGSEDPAEINRAWQETYDQEHFDRFSWMMLGIPSTAGAASISTAAAATTLIRSNSEFGSLKDSIFDLGDVLTIPHLLHDELLNSTSLAEIRNDLFGSPDVNLPVSPLSVAEAVYGAMLKAFPGRRILALGGDHSITSACLRALSAAVNEPLGILHFDAYPDLAATRFGLRHTYSTWLADSAQSAPLVIAQCGIAQSTLRAALDEWPAPIFQITRDDVQAMETMEVAQRINAFLESHGIRKLYVSLDVSVTDSSQMPCTVLPAQSGLWAEQVHEVLRGVARNFDIVGADVVEAAPSVYGPTSSDTTCRTVIGYLREIASLESNAS